jgi:tellurite resistance protein
MGRILIPMFIGAAASAAIIVVGFINRNRLAELFVRLNLKDLLDRVDLTGFLNRLIVKDPPRNNLKPSVEIQPELDLTVLNSRVKLVKYEEDECECDAFDVEICGSIHAPRDVESATLKIWIMDTTQPEPHSYPVCSQVKQWQEPDSSIFCYSASLGKLPQQVTTIHDWTSMVQLRLDWLELPRKGNRELMFVTSVFPAEGGEKLACARYYFNYNNPDFGYLDVKENIQRSKTLAVALAFAVSAADNRLYDCEVELIKDWTSENIDLSQTSAKEQRKLEKAFNETIAFFKGGNKLDNYSICREIVEIAPEADRRDIMNLCLHVAQANGSISTEELNLLKDFANWLEIDIDKFREMIQKVFPVDMYEEKDVETILGVTSDMNKERARRHLNKEYSKWSARVTNSDPEIQSQADQMLKLIAEARSQYVG